jgi:serine/threonine protein kinase
LQPHAICVTYKAEINKVPAGCQGLPFKEGSHVVVKFVSRYGEDAHQFLEKQCFAPALFYIGKVLAWEGAIKAHLSEVKPLTQGLTFTTSMMVVMEFVENAKLEVLMKKDLAQQVANIIHCLHCAGLAFGDLQPPNILVDLHLKRIKFIDFNWAGQFDPRLLETEANLQGVPSIIRCKIKAMEDLPLEMDTARFPLNINSEVFEGLGSSLGLTPILPWHDWKMWSLHFGGFLNTDIIFGTLG